MQIKSGVYAIECLINDNRYVGSSKNLYFRWHQHKKSLRKNKHSNAHLQNAWNKYGEQSFEFVIIECVEIPKLLEKENYWLKTIQCNYNIRLVAESNLGLRWTHGEDFKNKKREFRHSEETLLWLKEIANCPERIALLKQIHSGRTCSEEHKAKMSSIMKGKTWKNKLRTKEHVENNMKSRNQAYLIIDPNGVEMVIKGLKRFCKIHGLTEYGMKQVYLKKRENFIGWKCFIF